MRTIRKTLRFENEGLWSIKIQLGTNNLPGSILDAMRCVRWAHVPEVQDFRRSRIQNWPHKMRNATTWSFGGEKLLNIDQREFARPFAQFPRTWKNPKVPVRYRFGTMLFFRTKCGLTLICNGWIWLFFWSWCVSLCGPMFVKSLSVFVNVRTSTSSSIYYSYCFGVITFSNKSTFFQRKDIWLWGFPLSRELSPLPGNYFFLILKKFRGIEKDIENFWG